MAGAEVRTPWHFWVVAVASLLWSAYGCYEYYLAQVGQYVHMQAWAVAA